jgi:hypothetical protein
MRTTLDLDNALLAEAMARFPKGTPKTVVLEEALRRLIVSDEPVVTERARRDPRIERMVAEGRMRLGSSAAPPPLSAGGMPLAKILADLAADREDR